MLLGCAMPLVLLMALAALMHCLLPMFPRQAAAHSSTALLEAQLPAAAVYFLFVMKFAKIA